MTTLKVTKNKFVIGQEISIVKIAFLVQMSHKHLHIRRKLFAEQSILPRQFLVSFRTHFSFQHNLFIPTFPFLRFYTSVRIRGFPTQKRRRCIPVTGDNFWCDPLSNIQWERSRSRRKKVKLKGNCGLWIEELDLRVKRSEARHRRVEVCEDEGFGFYAIETEAFYRESDWIRLPKLSPHAFHFQYLIAN